MADIKLAISDETRTWIKTILTDFASILSGQETSDDDRQRLKEQSSELINEVSKLKRFHDDGEPKKKSARKHGTTPASHLEIGYQLKREIINLIQQNQDFSIELFDDVPEEDRKALIEQNANLIAKLNELNHMPPRASIVPERTLNCSSTGSGKDNHHQSPVISNPIFDQTLSPTSNERLNQTLSPRPNQMLNQTALSPTSMHNQSSLKAAIEESVESRIEQLKQEFEKKLKRGLDERALLLDELFRQAIDQRTVEWEAKLNGLREQLTRELDVNAPEKVFNFNLPNVRTFFSETTKRFSEFFFCFSFKWSLLAYHVKKRGQVSDKSKYLQLHLFREDGLDEDKHAGQTINWQCNTAFEITILSQSSKVPDKVEAFEFVFVQPSEFASFGEDEFINYHQLQSGYIKPDGSIDIRVHLKINGFRRY